MRTVGVDLAAEAARTAVAIVDWRPGGAVVRNLRLGADDDAVCAAVEDAHLAGIDCPFGWPDGFVALVEAHHAGRLAAPSSSDRAWRRPLTMRATDLWVHEHTGLVPLSVAADRIAHAALRLTAVLARLTGRGINCARDGSGRVAEVYPAAALKSWGLPFRGYKGPAGQGVREVMVARLAEHAPWLELGGARELCVRSDDALDALVCALVARAVAQGASARPVDRVQARREGWIHLPTGPLARLVPGATSRRPPLADPPPV